MKYKFLSGCLALALGGQALSQTADFYQNDGIIISPPQIPPQVDATNFVNNNLFSINFTNFTQNAQAYKTANTLNFTNTGLMIVNSGFQFDTGPATTGQRHMASSFANSGTISAGSALNNTNLFFNFFFGAGFSAGFLPRYIISATNVVLNSSTNIVGLNGLFSLSAKNVDLTRGNILMEGFDETTNFFFNGFFFINSTLPGMSDGYWGVGRTAMSPAGNFNASPPQTPGHQVTFPGGLIGFQQLVLPLAKTYVAAFAIGTNAFVQAVYLSNTNSAISNNVYFPSSPRIGQIDVEWIGLNTNVANGATSTNYLYLFDDFGTGISNRFATNFLSWYTYFTGQPTAIPNNYFWCRGGPLALGIPEIPASPAGFFNPFGFITNDYAAYRAIFSPTTVLPTDLPGPSSQLTNLPGRIEIGAQGVLDMSNAHIAGLNYLGIKATNQFAGSSGADITVPWSDINLATTNGTIAITNLLAPTIPRLTGNIDLWSGRWQEDWGGFRWNYHILFVDSHLNTTAPALIQDLTLRSTNVLISDVLNVTRNLRIETERLTITTNQLPAPTASGEINLLSSQIVWSNSLPRLQYLTNNGAIRALNAVFFGGSRTSPFFTSNYNAPYVAFVNRGLVSTEGSLIWADYFANRGLFTAGSNFGSITLQAQTALLTNGTFLASGGDISVNANVLTNANHGLLSGRKLTLNIAEVLTDTIANTPFAAGLTNTNSWTVGSGFDLPIKPKKGDLLGTTLFERAALAQANHLWAAEDRGCSPAGFSDNVAIGRLILDGGNHNFLRFTAAPLMLTFDEAATQPVPPSGTPVRSGVYKPTDYTAPQRQMLTNGVPADIRAVLSLPYTNSLVNFRGTNNVNGNWRLFIDDRTTNYFGNFINWGWTVAIGVLSSNYTATTNFISINGITISTGSSENTNYVSANSVNVGSGTVLPSGTPSGGVVAQPYPSTNSVSLLLRNNQAVTNTFVVTNQIGPNFFVTNRTDRVYTTEHITNVVVMLSTPTVGFPADVDVLLVGPHGEKVMLMAGAGALDTTNRNALYVDYLELRNFTTNIDFNGSLTGVQIDPNMKIYYAQAVMNGVSVAERLSGANGGRFCWVSDYTGNFSSTSIVYGDGTTNIFNAALVQSCNIDSDGDGLVNCIDPEPLLPNLQPAALALVVNVTNQPPLGAVVSWRAFPNSSNAVFFKSAQLGNNWQLLTNFVLGGVVPGRVSVFDPMAANATRFYRVQVGGQH